MVSCPSLIYFCEKHILSRSVLVTLKWCWGDRRKMIILNSNSGAYPFLLRLDFNKLCLLIAAGNHIFDPRLELLVESFLPWNLKHWDDHVWIWGIHNVLFFHSAITWGIEKDMVGEIVRGVATISTTSLMLFQSLACVIVKLSWGVFFFVVELNSSMMACNVFHRNNSCLLKKFKCLWWKIFWLFLRTNLLHFSLVLKCH